AAVALTTDTHRRSLAAFVRPPRARSRIHGGSSRGPEPPPASRNARHLSPRRTEGSSVWVVPSEAISSTDPDSKRGFFESAKGKAYRHATYYNKNEGMPHQ